MFYHKQWNFIYKEQKSQQKTYFVTTDKLLFPL